MLTGDQFPRAKWRKSSRSGGGGEGGGDCIEVGDLSGVVAMRDSKDPNGPRLALGRAAFSRLVSEIRAGEHDL